MRNFFEIRGRFPMYRSAYQWFAFIYTPFAMFTILVPRNVAKCFG